VYQSLLSAKSVTISIIISISIIITIRPHCWFCLCPLFWRVKKFLRKDERGNIFAFLGRRRSQATGGGQEMVLEKKIAF